jgi:hypothetical protein
MISQLKILYASSQKTGTNEQLNRFLQAIVPSNYIVKIAAYYGVRCIRPVDWILNALHDVFCFDRFSMDGDNLEIYYQQIKNFHPDLIISELEPFTSHVAALLQLPIWQISPFLLWEGWDGSHPIGLERRYQHLLPEIKEHRRMLAMLAASNANLICSHLGDLAEPPRIKSGFDFIRPYHFIGHHSVPCQHRVVGITTNNNRALIRLLSSYDDAILFTDVLSEMFPQLTLKDAKNAAEYSCNLFNSPHFICRGDIGHLADAFYNGKYCVVMPDFTDRNSVVNAYLNQHFQLGQSLYGDKDRLPIQIAVPLPHYNPQIKLLHERLLDL